MKALFRAAAVAVSLGGMLAGAATAEHHGHDASMKLDAVLEAQPDAIKARYQYRHPKQALEFFGVKPGMTVADTLPGEYYSRILLPYLGDDGALIGVQYSLAHRAIDWKGDAEKLANHKGWPARFTAAAEQWRGGSEADISAHLFGDFPASMDGSVDVFLMVRATHHLHKHEETGGTLSSALADIMRLLKPGGTLGIIQHRAPEGNSDEWAKGFNGYVKQDAVVKAVTAAGFELVETSEMNANPKDQPTENDYVWRLPPSGDAKDIGESDRMTLKFRKPE
ncbi:class I SAM-dependent methyltransferase [Kordiimonas lacus]|uniref:Predicted methyltransferase n=1 Tax=Kordiimonas lacus TaxID=637679 RepID=A0A1G7CAC5_9PROT|nr:methyltransferase domain-containing protein [Kordiimonas lacus]SDE36163.1 Predicted methyltransferase [Kordiimonas lacus]